MLSFTETARQAVLSFAEYMERPALRIALAEGASPLAPEYEFLLVEEEDTEAGDIAFDADGIRVVVDAASAAGLKGCTVEYVERGFAVRAPGFEPPPAGEYSDGELARRVERVIEEGVNPGVASHGGRITLVDVRDGVVYIEMSGGCQGCAMSRVTLRQGVERMIRQLVPEIVAVQDVTDHARGSSPYYQAAR